MRKILRGTRGPHAHGVYVLEGRVTIGRAAHADVQIDDASVSRQHAVITIDARQRATLVDLASMNGTQLRGQRIHNQPLNHGDTIQIGPAEYVFEETRDDAAETSEVFRTKVTTVQTLGRTREFTAGELQAARQAAPARTATPRRERPATRGAATPTAPKRRVPPKTLRDEDLSFRAREPAAQARHGGRAQGPADAKPTAAVPDNSPDTAKDPIAPADPLSLRPTAEVPSPFMDPPPEPLEYAKPGRDRPSGFYAPRAPLAGEQPEGGDLDDEAIAATTEGVSTSEIPAVDPDASALAAAFGNPRPPSRPAAAWHSTPPAPDPPTRAARPADTPKWAKRHGAEAELFTPDFGGLRTSVPGPENNKQSDELRLAVLRAMETVMRYRDLRYREQRGDALRRIERERLRRMERILRGQAELTENRRRFARVPCALPAEAAWLKDLVTRAIPVTVEDFSAGGVRFSCGEVILQPGDVISLRIDVDHGAGVRSAVIDSRVVWIDETTAQCGAVFASPGRWQVAWSGE